MALESKQDKIKLGIAIGVLLLAAILIGRQFLPDGNAPAKPGEVATPTTITAPEQPADGPAPTRKGGMYVPPGQS